MKLIKKAKLQEKSFDFETRKMALAQFLKISVDELDEIEEGYDEKNLTYGREEYLVLTDDEADDEFKTSQENLWNEMGIASFSEDFRTYIMEHLVDEKAFWRDYSSDIEEMIADSPESYSSYFDIDEVKKEILKYADKGKIDAFDIDYTLDEDDFEDKKDFKKAIEDAIDDLDDEEALKILNDSGYLEVSDAAESYIENFSSPYDYLSDIYGERDSENLTKALEPYLDLDKVFEEIKDQDGRGSTLASYDGEENEVKYEGTWLYIYRTN